MKSAIRRATAAVAIATTALSVLGAAWLGTLRGPAAAEMVRAAQAFLNALTPDQRNRAVFDFSDPERLNWHYIPRARKGLPLKEMTDEQRQAAHALLHAGLSAVGYRKATTIMALEAVLHELERGGRIQRDPELYYWSIFGTPSMDGEWGWRVEGHHLSLNFVVRDGKVVSATPAFFGANPGVIKNEVPGGLPVGTRALADEELVARKLVTSLSNEQLSLALLSKTPPRDIRGGGAPQPPRTKPEGLPAKELNAEQRELLWRLLKAYAGNMPDEVRDAWLGEIEASGIENVYFAWAGGFQEGQPHYYRIQGPGFLVEYCNVQSDSAGNPANHIHSVWRSLHGDFGLPLD